MNVRLMLFHDPEVENWGFRVPALQLVGGGCATREEALQHALDAISYALEDADDQDTQPGEVEVIDLALRLVS